VLYAWLASMRLDHLCELFLQAGYDMPTVSRMTPEVCLFLSSLTEHRRILNCQPCICGSSTLVILWFKSYLNKSVHVHVLLVSYRIVVVDTVTIVDSYSESFS